MHEPWSRNDYPYARGQTRLAYPAPITWKMLWQPRLAAGLSGVTPEIIARVLKEFPWSGASY
jgi:hypothetical protein